MRRARGVWITPDDVGRIDIILRAATDADVRLIVVTDNERILGLGDQGASGMGIPVGKLSLYTACAGIDPRACLPVTIDVGTNNSALLEDPLYIGLPRNRLEGAAYDELIDEFIDAVQAVFPSCLVQFEDFANKNAFRLLHKYRDRICTFNDDIQGTAAVAYAGIISALRTTGGELRDQKILFLGAGEAGIGIGDLTVSSMVQAGMTLAAARRRCWFMDSQGLVVSGRGNLAEHKLAYAHDHPRTASLVDAIRDLEPTALVGVSGQPQTFTQPVIEAMSELNSRPIVMALSNPTSKAECTAKQAYGWSKGRAIFASGSPFPAVEYEGRTLVPGQGNNAYIFPGVGLGVLASGARHVTDEMFQVAAHVLADQVSGDERERGCIYPSLSRIRDVSSHIATAVAEVAYATDLATRPHPDDMHEYVLSQMYEPNYRDYL
jgi:malate dehydrogenase (oxaloacetate-decarboxylating)(NADP+)